MRAICAAALLLGCGGARYEIRDETVTLRANSDDSSSPAPQVQEPSIASEVNGFCLLTFGGEHPFSLWYSRGLDGTRCLVRIGTRAAVTLLFVEGAEGFGVLSLRWTP